MEVKIIRKSKELIHTEPFEDDSGDKIASVVFFSISKLTFKSTNLVILKACPRKTLREKHHDES